MQKGLIFIMDMPRSLSKCELVIHIDENDLHLPINLGMNDDEIRQIYPYLLSLSKPEDNPMIKYVEMKKAGAFDKLSEDEKEDYIGWTRRLSKYWYDKASTSILDVAIGIAIDMKFNNFVPDLANSNIESSIDENEIIDKAEIKDITEEEILEINRRFNITSDADAPVDSGIENSYHTGVAGDLDVNMYGAESFEDFISKEIDDIEMEKRYHSMFDDILKADTKPVDYYVKKTEAESNRRNMSESVNSKGLLKLYNDVDVDYREDIKSDIDDIPVTVESDTTPDSETLPFEDDVSDYSDSSVPEEDFESNFDDIEDDEGTIDDDFSDYEEPPSEVSWSDSPDDEDDEE